MSSVDYPPTLCHSQSRYSAKVNSFVRMSSFELSDLEVEVTRVEIVQLEFERKSDGTPALAATLLGDGKSWGGDGQGSVTFGKQKNGKRHGDGRRNEGRGQTDQSQQ